MSTPNKTIGQRLREERKRLSLSQTDFAKAVGVHLNTQSRYEKGEREPDTAYLEAIGKAGVDVGYVMGHSKWTPAKKLESVLDSYRIGATNEPETDRFGNEIPWPRPIYGDGMGIGWLFLFSLGVSDADWNRIVEKLVRLDETGTPVINGNDPAWGREIVQSSGLIQGFIAEASALDSSLLKGILEGVDMALSAQQTRLEPTKKAQTVAMLYRSFKASGKVDPAMIEEAVKLASG